MVRLQCYDCNLTPASTPRQHARGHCASEKFSFIGRRDCAHSQRARQPHQPVQ